MKQPAAVGCIISSASVSKCVVNFFVYKKVCFLKMFINLISLEEFENEKVTCKFNCFSVCRGTG